MIEREKIKEILRRSAQDTEFRKRLIADPRSVLETELGKIPENVNFHVIEKKANTLYLLLPQPGGELSDDALDNVSGGFFSVDEIL